MDDQRTRLRALYNAATQTPWRQDGCEVTVVGSTFGVDGGETVIAECALPDCIEVADEDREEQEERNAALIVGAVNALPTLLDAIDAAESLRPRDPHRTGHRCACCGREGAPEADALCPWCSEGRAAERERDDARAIIETLRAEAALLREQLAALTARVDELEESVAMGCQSPATGCDCAGCLYAAERGGAL